MFGMHPDQQVPGDADDDTYVCIECDEPFDASDFDHVDDELNSQRPMCPPCQRAARLEGAECEICGRPATEEVELGLLCDDCHADYVDGYSKHD